MYLCIHDAFTSHRDNALCVMMWCNRMRGVHVYVDGVLCISVSCIWLMSSIIASLGDNPCV